MASLGFWSCTQPSSNPRFDSMLAQGMVASYGEGDLIYADGVFGSTGSPQFGEVCGPASFPDGGINASITVGAATTKNGVAGVLPTGSAAAIAVAGFGYGFDPTVTYDGELTGNGLTTPALIQFTTCTAVTFTASLTAATSATLTAGLAEGNGQFFFGFSDGSRKLVTVTGTACTWTGAVTATTAATYSQGGTGTFTGSLTGATQGTLSSSLPNGTYLFVFSDGSYRVTRVTGGTTAKWGLAVTGTSAFSYANGAIKTATVIAGGAGATNTGGNANFGLANWNGTSGFVARRFNASLASKGFRDLQAGRLAGVPAYFKPDDHDRNSNNWDGSVTQAPWPCTSAADVLDFWRTWRTALRTVVAANFDNQPTFTNVDVPSALVGAVGSNGVTASAADFDCWYLRHDYDANLRRVGTAGAGVLAFSVISLDCVSLKSPQNATNNASKVMLGAAQKAQFKADCLALKNSGVRAIFGLCGKDFFNADNADGWGATANAQGYPTYSVDRDELLQWCHDNAIPIVWMTGDRHCWHVAMTSVALNGDAYDHLSVCATPLGSLNNTSATTAIGNTAYPQMLAQGRKRNQCVHGFITPDLVNNRTLLQIIENATDKELCCAMPAFGARTLTDPTTQFRQLAAS